LKRPQRLAFKYRSGDEATLPRDLLALQESRFYAGTRHALNDPFEGRFDRSYLDAQTEAIRTAMTAMNDRVRGSFEDVSHLIEEVLSFVEKCGIFSLSYNPLNELIWAHYGGSHKGFCIGYDLEKLISFEPTQFNCIEVAYTDCEPSVEVGDLLLEESHFKMLQKILGTKSSPWSYEQEIRVVTTPPGLHEHDFRAVKEVYFGLRCSSDTRQAVMQALAGRHVQYKQITSLHPSYLLAAEEIPDAFSSDPPYRGNIAPIAEHAIYTSNLKPELKQYADFLQMAAEIVRRDPYCPLVEIVEFSTSRSTPQNPVIFVQYQRAPGKWVTKHFTLDEIAKQYNCLSDGVM